MLLIVSDINVKVTLGSIFLVPYWFPFSILNKPGYKSGTLYFITGKRYLTISFELP